MLFKKTQKLLDRFIFIFFAEDRQLLPPNSTVEIIKQWTDLKEKYDAYFPLYDRFKKYFGYLNTGRKGKQYDIYPYNGGLFAPDDILDAITINDDILHQHTLKLSTYDFNTELDEYILSHIFENSISDIEAVQADIKGQDVDRKKSRRKKDGIFYTPKFITKTMIDNTVGRLCADRRRELGIVDADYHNKQRRDVKRKLLAKLDDYRDWLLNLTICDPACGSGAFLNQALDFLIEEHHKINQLKANLLGQSLILSDIETDILERNLYGVDLNEESVEIAKLSLWLRTATKGRKLNDLNNNIKCGNSLIADPAIAGDKAFDWQQQFPEVFANGGFDVVVGNPPYGATLTHIEKQNLAEKYTCFNGNFDIYSAFIQLAFQLIKTKSYWAFINPVSWQNNELYLNVRSYIKGNGQFVKGLKLPYDIFADAYVDTGIYYNLTDEEIAIVENT